MSAEPRPAPASSPLPAPAGPRGAPALLAWLGLAVPLIVGLALAAHTLSDLDIWLHDRAGRDLLATGRLPRQNTYSFTAPGQAWVDHEWLYQVGVAAAGGGGTPAAKAVAWGCCRLALTAWLVLLLWREAAAPGPRRGRPEPRRAAALALPALAALALLWVRIDLRPELLSLAGLVLAARWLSAALSETPAAGAPAPASGWARWRPLFSPRAPAGRTFWLTVAWAQCHGFWLLMPALWLLAVILEPLDRRLAGRSSEAGFAAARGAPPRAPARAPVRAPALATPLGPLGPVLATFAAGALTPNHIAGLLYPFHALTQLGDGVELRSLIAEMTPLLAAQNHLGLTVLVFKACLAWSVVWALATAGRVPLWRLALLAAAFAATLQSQRNLGLCAVAFHLAHAGYDPARAWLWRRRGGPRQRAAAAPTAAWASAAAKAASAAPLACLALAAAAAFFWLPQLPSDRFYLREGTTRRFGLGLTPTQFPFAAADRVRELGQGRPLRVANNIDAASTLVNTGAAAVFVDGRTEAYPVAVWRDYLALRAGGEAALATLGRRQVEAVVLAHGNPGTQRWLETMLGSPQWRLAMADDVGVVFVPAAAAAGGGAEARAAAQAANAPLLREAAARLLAELPASGGGVRAADRCLTLSSLLKAGGLDREAEALARRGLAARPDHPLLNHNLGNLMLGKGEPVAAAELFRAALRARPGLVDSRLNLGVALFRGGDPAAAAREFAAATRRAPDRFDAWANLAEARLQLGDRAGAAAALRRAAALRPDDPRLRQRLDALGGAP